MKFTGGILLALFSLTAASFMQQHGGISVRHINVDNTDNLKLNHNNNDNSNNQNNYYQADQLFLLKQKTILHLLSNLQDSTSQELYQLENNFNPFQNLNKFINQKAVSKFLKNYNNKNFLPQNEAFTPTSQQHHNQAAQIFNFLYSAQDWNIFKQAAAWVRNRFNSEQFVYAFTSAVLNHPSTQGIVLPAMYEILPHAFIPATALHQIYKANVQGYRHVTVYANYTNQNKNNFYNGYNIGNNDNNINRNYGPHNPNLVFAENDGSQINNAGTSENPENRMSYFTEDVGVNAFHANYHIQNPSFYGSNNNNNYFTGNSDYNNDNYNINMNKEEIRRGEAFYYAHQQLYARYVLERLSNNLPIPHPVNFNDKIKTGFNPNLQYSNGQAVPARPPNTKFQQQLVENNNNNNNAQQPNNNQGQTPQVYEMRIQEVAESGYVLNPDGTKTKLNNVNAVGILANLVAAPVSSLNPDYYGDYFSAAKDAIGNIVDPNNQNNVAPGAVAYYATAARDPAYYQFLAKINQIFNNLQNKQGPYTRSQVAFVGVKIQSLDVSDLVTFFQYFNVNVNNAIPKNNNNNNNNLNYNVRFQRLTNKPFNYRLNVISEKSVNAVVRIFIGPKYDSNGQQFTLPQASKYFVQLDQFTVKLHSGQNLIQRNSQESQNFVEDSPSFQQLWNLVEKALQGQQSFYVNKAESRHCGFPMRAQLPKGKRNGQQFVMYAIINDPDNTNNNNDNQNNILNVNNKSQNVNTGDNLSNNDYNIEYNRKNNYSYNRHFESFYCGGNNYNQLQDNRSIGFPFDRPVVDSDYATPNQYFKTVTIYHKVQNN